MPKTSEQKALQKRQRKLESICRRIATFMIEETFHDEAEAHVHLDEAIRSLDKAKLALKAE